MEILSLAYTTEELDSKEGEYYEEEYTKILVGEEYTAILIKYGTEPYWLIVSNINRKLANKG